MGWASAGYNIFNPVAREIQKARVNPEDKKRILSKLIECLQQGDWDTEDESLEEFSDEPMIVEAFRENGVPFDGGSW